MRGGGILLYKREDDGTTHGAVAGAGANGARVTTARESLLRPDVDANGRGAVHGSGCSRGQAGLWVRVEESMFKWILKCECQFHGLASQQERGRSGQRAASRRSRHIRAGVRKIRFKK